MMWRVSTPFLLAAALALALGDGFLLLVWVAAMCHELSHLLALRLLRCPVRGAALTLGGLRIDYHPRALSYRQDCLLALAGPAGNLAAAALAAAASHLWSHGAVYRFLGASLLLAGFNLLPAFPLDGGRVAFALLAPRFGPDRAERLVRICGAALGAGLLAGGAWLLRCGGNASLALAGGLLFYENALQKSSEPLE